jgi:hypothetical protein
MIKVNVDEQFQKISGFEDNSLELSVSRIGIASNGSE